MLASCNISQRRVTVARELNYANLQHWFEPLLFHEMCHAVLADTIKAHLGRRPWHGAEFKALESRHPQVAALHKWMKEGGWKHAVRSDRARRRSRASKHSIFSLTKLFKY